MQPAGPSAGKQPGRERPKRTAQEWRPVPLLCKRLNVPDPFRGRPQELTMSRFRTDHLALPDTELQSVAVQAPATAAPLPLPPPPGLSPTGHPALGNIASPSGGRAVPPQDRNVGAAADMRIPELPTQEVQDARALADDFLASLGLHASGAEPPAAAAAASGGAPAAAASAAASMPDHTGQQQSQVVASRDETETAAPDVVTAAALERRAALHRSIFGDDQDSESDEGEDEAGAAPASDHQTPPAAAESAHAYAETSPAGLAAATGFAKASSGIQHLTEPTSSSAALGDVTAAPDEQQKSRPAGGGVLGAQQIQNDSVLGLPTGMQSRPVFMSKKARAALAVQKSAKQPSPAPPSSPGPQAASTPLEGGSASSEPARQRTLPHHAADVVRPAGVPAGALEDPAGPSIGLNSENAMPSAELGGDGASSSSGRDDDGDERTEPQARVSMGHENAAGQNGAGVHGPPPGMSAIQWQREQDARLQDSRARQSGKAKKHSKVKDKSRDKSHKHKHKKHKHKTRK